MWGDSPVSVYGVIEPVDLRLIKLNITKFALKMSFNSHEEVYSHMTLTDYILLCQLDFGFCIVYKAVKPRVDYANQDLTVLVPIIADPLTC